MRKGQAERLLPLLEELLSEAALGWEDLALIGVGIGPGNFTGVRIAVSTARGLALGTGVQAVGISTFEALAFDLKKPVAACVSGMRESVYVQIVGEEDISKPVNLQCDEVPGHIGGSVNYVVGANAHEIAAACGLNAVEPNYTTAEAIGRAAWQFHTSRTHRPAPLYVRPPDAKPARLTK